MTSVELIWRIGSVGFNADGSVTAEFERYLIMPEGDKRVMEVKRIDVDKATVDAALDTLPNPDVTIREQIIGALYQVAGV